MRHTFKHTWLVILPALIGLCLLVGMAHAEPVIDFNKLASAIYKAEGGSKTAHPYGILAKYKTTTPRQACLNTIKHKYADYLLLEGRSEATELGYLAYLSSKYAPLGASNDPMGLNANWLANVRYFYDRA